MAINKITIKINTTIYASNNQRNKNVQLERQRLVGGLRLLRSGVDLRRSPARLDVWRCCFSVGRLLFRSDVERSLDLDRSAFLSNFCTTDIIDGADVSSSSSNLILSSGAYRSKSDDTVRVSWRSLLITVSVGLTRGEPSMPHCCLYDDPEPRRHVLALLLDSSLDLMCVSL